MEKLIKINFLYSAAKTLRSKISRTRWAAKLLDLPCEPVEHPRPGLVMIQIDGLAFRQFERALERKRLPFIHGRLTGGGHFYKPFYSGVPSTTPAVQGELFFGKKGAVPAFEFYNRKNFDHHVLFYPRSAEFIANSMDHSQKPLLAGGRSYSNIYSGGAEEARYCVESMKLESLLKSVNPFKSLLVLIMYFPKVIRILGYAVFEIWLAMTDFVRGIIRKRNFFKELKFIPTRVFICIILRELIRFRVKLDVAQGVRIIHANLVGYDEQAHRRGPDSKFAHWTLKGIDDVIRNIHASALKCGCRDYRLIVYSDHGQERVIPYEKQFGKTVQQAIMDALADSEAAFPDMGLQQAPDGKKQPPGRSRWFPSIRKNREAPDTARIQLSTMGPLGHVYFPSSPSGEELESLALRLVQRAHIPLVLFIRDNEVKAADTEGIRQLSSHKEEILGRDHPLLQYAAEDLERTVRHPYAGDLVISGWHSGKKPLTFAVENGAHGGPGREETRGFVLLPDGAGDIPEILRPLDLRNTAIRLLSGNSRQEFGKLKHAARDVIFRVMSYNIHSCINIRKKCDPEAVIDIISECSPDIIALQEVDVHMERTQWIDQAALIAKRLRMSHDFFPLLCKGSEEYGIAVLSKFPYEKVKFDCITPADPRVNAEPRGAMWAKITTPGGPVHFMNTHLGLTAKERLIQIRALLGKEWGRIIPEDEPFILCGDLNSGVRTPVYRRIAGRLFDVQVQVAQPGYPRATFFSMYPVLRIDHIFASRHLTPVSVHVPASFKARIASDHLPVVVELKMVK